MYAALQFVDDFVLIRYKLLFVFVLVQLAIYNCMLKVATLTQLPPVVLLSVLEPLRPGRSARPAVVPALAAAAAAAEGLSTRRA